MPARYNIEIWKGATFRKTLTLYQGNSVSTPVEDLTDYVGELVMREAPESTTIYLTLTTENGGITIDGPEGAITLLIDAEDTGAVIWKYGVYDFTITAPNGGDTEVLLYGGIKVRGI